MRKKFTPFDETPIDWIKKGDKIVSPDKRYTFPIC